MRDLDRFLKQPELARLWPLVRAKYEQLGRVGGTVGLPHVSDAEREALSGLLVKNLHGQTDVAVRLSQLDAALRATRFALSLEECLAVLYPDTLRTRHEERSAAEEQWQNFCAWTLSQSTASSQNLQDWVRTLVERKAVGYRTFLECYEEFRTNGDHSPSWETAMVALNQLPMVDGQRLPIFAARMTGDAHGLDRDRLVGRLFFYGVRALTSGAAEFDGGAAEVDGGVAVAVEGALDGGLAGAVDGEEDGDVGAEAHREMYTQVGILLDDVSSIVWVAGLPGISIAPVAVPLRTLERLVLSLSVAPPRVYVVENPSIFSALLDASDRQAQGLRHPLVCTSGQPSLAALRLLDRAAHLGANIYYSGDFDVKGMQMAHGLKDRYPGTLQLWRMDRDSYLSGLHPSAPMFSEWELSQLSRILGSDVGLYAAMAERRRKVYQEHLVESLVRDYFGTGSYRDHADGAHL